MSTVMKYNEGDIVNVKLSGLIVCGIIKKVRENGDYIVEFESGTEKDVSERAIKSVESKNVKTEKLAPKIEVRSPSRRSPSRRSPARSVSQTRRAKASPSPSRRKSPARKSLPRIQKVDNEDVTGDSPANFPRRRKPIDKGADLTSYTVPYHNIIEPLYKDAKSEVTNNKELVDTVARQFERIIHLKPTSNVLNDLGKFSDDEVIVESKQDRISEPKILIPSKEFGGWFGALILIFLIPAAVVSLHVICKKNSCTFTSWPVLQKYKLLNTYFDAKVLGFYFGYLLLITILSRIPIGGKKINSQPSKNKSYTYCMNGLMTAFIVLGTVIALEVKNVPIMDIVLDNQFQLLVSALLSGILFSVLLFIGSKFVTVSQLNTHAVTYNFIYDFFIGREVNPRVLGVDIKLVLLRASYIAVLIINSIYLFKSLKVTVISHNEISLDDFGIEPALLTSCVLQILYTLDMLIFEKHLTTTFELQYEGLGYMKTMLYSVNPFLMTSITKYLYEHGVQQHMNLLLITATVMVFLAGYILHRGSNSQKNAFRLNPYNPALSHLESIPTAYGKKLLISGYWGKIRHPNYAGDILMLMAMSILCAPSPAALGIIPSMLVLIHRAVRDDHRCKRRYGSAWDRYSHKVPYVFFPNIY